MYRNPKLYHSCLIDAVPVPGPCPLNCPECFYNRAFYAPLDEPILPPVYVVGGKIVRINSGGDSNIHRNYVIESTSVYMKKFYNTSIPRFDFPAPVVFTCNSKSDSWFHAVADVSNLMFVRVRTNTWNIDLVDNVVDYYTRLGVPVVLTMMRYFSRDRIKRLDDYEFKKHILNSYYCVKADRWRDIWARYSYNERVFSCGSPASALCRDCGSCAMLYWHKVKAAGREWYRVLKRLQNRNFQQTGDTHDD